MKLACGTSALSDEGVRCLSHANKVNQGPNMVATDAPQRRESEARKAKNVQVTRDVGVGIVTVVKG